MRSFLLLPLLFAACASTEPNREPAVEEVDHDRKMAAEDAKRRDFRAVLVRLDQSIDSYVQALSNQGEYRADETAERLYKMIHETVTDTRPMYVRAGQAAPPPGETFNRLQAVATDGSNPNWQGIALAALGFSDRHEVMPTILQGAQLSDPFVADRAVLGLAMLRAPATPPGVLAAIISNPTHPEDGRGQAAWALYRVQTVSTNGEAIAAIWRRLLTDDKDRLPAVVLVSCVRGLGIARNIADGPLVATFLKHPTARVRMAAALALGRMKAGDQWEDLLAVLGPEETVQNVRLHARKALAELAGGAYDGYDVTAWRKVFQRGGH